MHYPGEFASEMLLVARTGPDGLIDLLLGFDSHDHEIALAELDRLDGNGVDPATDDR